MSNVLDLNASTSNAFKRIALARDTGIAAAGASAKALAWFRRYLT